MGMPSWRVSFISAGALLLTLVALSTVKVSAHATVAAPLPKQAFVEIINVNSGKCLDIRTEDGAFNNGARIQQINCKGIPGQRWKFVPVGDGRHHQIVSELSGKCIDVNGGWIGNGVPIIQHDCHSGWNQQWAITALGTFPVQTYTFTARHSGQCLDVPRSSTGNEVPLWQHTCNGTAAQQFRLR
ncbi:RICIN domain-containing protein [Kibdelosporangium philippinense]|uniref:RICIN domain-containing protein n=1 Tax=Kibdelosporangium philippinense TaxID=211113 RepID=A0ABS8ZP06_9PSEU|nr:RICIN domain-containing protein [Kibdelosporangium philippinense]MCE7009277.1 RICIN domain-containing protein [Kibdelosporangium philippinense]